METGVFDRAVAAIDGSPESLDALRLLLRLAPADTAVAAVGVLDAETAVHAGWAAPSVEAELRRDLQEGLGKAVALDARVSAHLVSGSVLSSLQQTLRERGATLVAVGSHGLSRAVGIAIGSIATSLLHSAPCSVLVGRASPEAEGAPTSIVVGVDGSPASETALRVAQELSERLDVPLEAVVATGGRGVHSDRVASLGLTESHDERHPVAALVERSLPGSLVVVGSRGLHGVRALGSVSERVAHRGRGPVLVVRQSSDANR
jgi:nucleotide-binding universal stress UspA family protein